jgi:hypothetical protein
MNPLTQNINPNKVANDYKVELDRLVPTIDVAFVGNLLSSIFGVESPVYLPTWWEGRDYIPGAYSGVTLKNDTPDDGSPMRMGNKTFGSFWLKGGKYRSYNQYTGLLEQLDYPDFLMPLATLVDFNRPKAMTKTPCIGSSGTVKEIFGFEDWAISIKGIILPDKERAGSTFQTVEGQMEALQKFFEIADGVTVDGKLFANRNINKIVLESLVFNPVQGKPKLMTYAIEATSDEDILLMQL